MKRKVYNCMEKDRFYPVLFLWEKERFVASKCIDKLFSFEWQQSHITNWGHKSAWDARRHTRQPVDLYVLCPTSLTIWFVLGMQQRARFFSSSVVVKNTIQRVAELVEWFLIIENIRRKKGASGVFFSPGDAVGSGWVNFILELNLDHNNTRKGLLWFNCRCYSRLSRSVMKYRQGKFIEFVSRTFLRN